MTLTNDAALVDELFMAVGWWGRYQQIQFFMAMFPWLACAFNAMSVIFLGRSVAHVCAPVDSLMVTLQEGDVTYSYDVIKNQSMNNLTVKYGSCSIDVMNGSDVVFTTACTLGYEYTEPVDRSFVSQYDLVCERESLADLSQTCLALGMVVGAFTFTSLADRFGRRPMFMICHVGQFLTAAGIAFSPNVVTFLVLKFCLGSLQQGAGLITTIILLELFPKSERAFSSKVGNFVWALSLMVLCLISYLARDISWRYTQLIFAAANFTVLFQWWVSDETLRWLIANNKFEELERVMKKAARINKVEWHIVQAVLKRNQAKIDLVSINTSSLSTSESIQITELNGKQQSIETGTDVKDGEVADNKSTAKDNMMLMAFVKNRPVMIMTAINCFMWFTDSVTYYGLLLMSSSLAENLYLGFFLNVLAEVPMAFVYLGIDRFGRKRCVIFSHFLSAFPLLVATLLSSVPAAASLPGIKIAITVVTLLGKFGISFAFSTIWLYSSEMYPTNVRNTGLGISAQAARTGGMIAPFSRTFSRHLPWGPGAVFGSLCLLVLVLIRFLPETTGEDLPQTLQDLDKWYEPSGKLRRPKKKT